MPCCSVCSAMSGEVLAVVEEYEGKTAKEMKQMVESQVGVTRFRQRFFSEDGSIEIRDDDVFASEAVKIQLVLLQFLPPDAEEDQKMIAAARVNDSKELETLLQEPRSPNIMDEDGRTPLHHAAKKGHVEPMRLLLEAGAEKDVRDAKAEGWTPMLLAAQAGHLESVVLLLQAGADRNLATLDSGATALFVAALRGHVRVVGALIEAGADLNQATRAHGTTALFEAVRLGHVEIVQLLIKAGADLNEAQTKDAYSVFDTEVFLTRLEVQHLLHQAKADIHISRMSHPIHQATPLCAAVVKGHVQIARLLIEAGADIERGDCGITPLWVAALKGHVDIVRFLIDAGANIENIRSSQPSLGTVPMLLAAQHGHVEVVRLLQQKAQQMRRASPALPSAGPLWYTWRPVPPMRVARVMQHVPITAVTFIPGATGALPNVVGSNPHGSTSSSSAKEARRKQKSCC